MSSDLHFSAQCPKCGNRTFDQSAGPDVNGELACPRCRYRAKLAEFADAATRARALEIGKQALGKAFKNVRGFKPKP